MLRFDAEETAQAPARARDRPAWSGTPRAPLDVDICFALGGDGTILTALRAYAGTGVPVFGVNYGEMGFLATVDRENADDGWRRALTGDFEMLSLPAIELSDSHGHRWLAMNDVSINRQQGQPRRRSRIFGRRRRGRPRPLRRARRRHTGRFDRLQPRQRRSGDGMGRGQGFVVSFIAPHSLTARPLVVAPADQVSVDNRSREEAVEVTVDGRPMCLLEAGEEIEAGFVDGQGCLAQVAGANFYHRLREKFGRLSSVR